ncbi:SnoaL-like protein [Thermosporothrix hazakensis]|jgi:hypothetical protein|uniref:SnoaL-like protein n=1 Tax=Thermosporothrix hazakensis TaxID=644383 RepID=A0A326UD14_THEHA|nr:nuclear transport factor 2 family protein [Thermosporothrix hazakensis]PZW32604.1 SnoaL-like protein [Thermosporothrix hazakensis]GCE49958.1 hypothetical protein KTH_48270 [Thermosporothrix hazakensis]
MINVICAEDCGNAPKKQQLKDYTIACANNNFSSAAAFVTDTIVWDIVGQERFEGINRYTQALERLKEENITELHIENIITHGNTGAINGTKKLGNGTTIAFCDVFIFTSTRRNSSIKAISSYRIPLCS